MGVHRTDHWLTLEGGTLALHKIAADRKGPAAGAPIISVDDPKSIKADQVNPQRFTLDNSVALIHLKFADPATREALFAAALQWPAPAAPAASEGGGAAKVERDPRRYPFELGKYWLGPMDPSKPFDPHDEANRGGYVRLPAPRNVLVGCCCCCCCFCCSFACSTAPLHIVEAAPCCNHRGT